MTNIERYILRTPRLISLALCAATGIFIADRINAHTLAGFLTTILALGLATIPIVLLEILMVRARWKYVWLAKFGKDNEEEAFEWASKATPETLNYVVGIYFGHYGERVALHNE